MFLHHSTNLEWNLHRARNPQHMYHDWKFERRKGEHVYIHIWRADVGFCNCALDFCHRMAQVAFWVKVSLLLVSGGCVELEGVCPSLGASSLSVDSLQCHFGMDGSSQFDFHKPSPCVVLSQLSPGCTLEIQHPASSLRGLLRGVSRSGVAFPPSLHAKTLHLPFSPYSRQGACLTVLAVPDLLALPQ